MPNTANYSIIDLRGDPTGPGWCLVGTDATTIPRAIDLGDDPKARIDHYRLRSIEQRLDLRLRSRTLAELAVELLTDHTTPPGDKTRPNPIRRRKDGTLRIRLGGETIYDEETNRGDVLR